MSILIAVILILIILGSIGTYFKCLILSSLSKRKKKASPASTGPIPDLTETLEISDEELKKKLKLLKILTCVKNLSIPAFWVIGLLILFLNWEIGTSKSVSEVFFDILLPVGIVFLLLVTTFFFSGLRVDKLKALMGITITLPIIKELFDVKIYLPNEHMPREIVASAGLVYSWDDISGSDYFEGSYKGVNILYSDLLLSHEETDTDSDGHKTTNHVTDFKGQWMVCDFGKELSATVRLIERKSGTMFRHKYDRSKSDVETENTEFNKKFRISTVDGHTAFYLLTPHFMERVIALDKMAKASALFCFQDGKVHIALYSGRDSFELKGVKLNSMEGVRQKFRDDLKYLTDIVDELLLNEGLFKKI